MDTISKHPYRVLAVMSLLHMWPWFWFYIGGDSLGYQVMIDCFANALSEGELRPSWCREVNHGFGAPIFFSYFPLAYILALLFYPLTLLGADTHVILTLLMCTLNVCLSFTCFMWLKRHIAASQALIISLCLLFIPYRMEVLFYRSALSELLAIALFPLWIICIEKILDRTQSWHILALLIGVTALAHTPMALIFSLISMLYILFYAKQIRPCISVGIAGMLGACLAAYYLIPAIYYNQFILGMAEASGPLVNRYPTWRDFQGVHNRKITLAICAIFGVAILYMKVYISKSRYPFSRSMKAWGLTAMVTAILISPLIGLIFDHSALVRNIFFPWRMQVVFIPLFGILLIALFKGKNPGPKRGAATWDFAVLFIFMLLLKLYSVQYISSDQDAKKVEQFEKHALPYYKEYFTKWMPNTLSFDSILSAAPPKVVQGQANISNIQKYSNQVIIEVDADKPSVVRLHQAYFPSWTAHAGDMRLEMAPEPGFGATLIDVPEGKHTITLENKPYSTAPIFVRASPWISLGALLFLVFSWRRRGSNA